MKLRQQKKHTLGPGQYQRRKRYQRRGQNLLGPKSSDDGQGPSFHYDYSSRVRSVIQKICDRGPRTSSKSQTLAATSRPKAFINGNEKRRHGNRRREQRARSGSQRPGRGEELHTCQLVSRETPETMIRIPGGLRDRGALDIRQKLDCAYQMRSCSPVVSFFIIFATRPTFFGELDYNAE